MSAGAGVLSLIFVWACPWSRLGLPPFSTHMFLHMVVVAVSSPLLVHAVMGSTFDPVRRFPWLSSAILASMIEMLGVWAWHAPGLHHAARSQRMFFFAEQLTFLFCGLFLWLAAFGGTPQHRLSKSLAGMIALLLTSMHMTLLGALIALAQRPLYGHHHGTHAPVALGISPLLDQQMGGAIMLFMGAGIYLGGGLLLLRKVLAAHRTERKVI